MSPAAIAIAETVAPDRRSGRGGPGAAVTSVPHAALVIDYCGSCRGTCPSCVLSAAERGGDGAWFTPEALAALVPQVAPLLPPSEELVIALGRGNLLTLDADQTDRALAALADAVTAAGAAARLRYRRLVLELSTSLIGRHEAHVARARAIRSALAGQAADPRFVVVVNAAISSNDRYWLNIRRFVEAVQGDRGGRDGAGDILQLNLTAAALPDLERLGALLQDYRFPVNVAWIAATDPAASDPGAVARLGRWLEGFLALARQLGLDCNLATYLDRAAPLASEPVAALAGRLEGFGRAALFVDRGGQVHRAALTILGDLDPVRAAPQPRPPKDKPWADGPRPDDTRADGGRADDGRAVAQAAEVERAALLAARSCRACPAAGLCLATGAWLTARTLLARAPARAAGRDCPIGLRDVLMTAAPPPAAAARTRP